MNQTVAGPAKGQKHLFVHSVRFWSMLAIVALHSFVIMDLQARQGGYIPSFTLECGLQVFKFATIAFFLISGFLLGERLPAHGAVKYFKRRLRNVGAPWLFWYSLCGVTSVLRVTVVQGNSWRTFYHHPAQIAYQFYVALIYTSFWFVPNLLLALACLLLLRRWIDSLWVGAAFGAFTLMYSVNIYTGWMPAEHTAALLGFVFFLWLGAWTSRHYQSFKVRLEAVPLTALLAAVVVTFALSLWEAHLLAPRNGADALANFNTIRFSNILFSVAATLAFMRIPGRSWPKFINVESTTYGVYLIHVLALTLFSGIRHFLHIPPPHSGVALYANWFGTFAGAYLTTIGLVHLLSLSRNTASLIGIRPPESRQQPASPLVTLDPAFK